MAEDHPELVARKLQALPPAAGDKVRNNEPVRYRKGKPLCASLKADGTPCGAFALGDDYGDASEHCMGHARALGLWVVEKDQVTPASASLTTASVQGTTPESSPDAFQLLKAEVQRNPKKYVDLWTKAAVEGRDVRALSAIFALIKDEQTVREVPSTMAAMERLTDAELDAVIEQLERETQGLESPAGGAGTGGPDL
jgi:hypothetical protein